MARHGNLADPQYEPSDDELGELVQSAFAGVSEKNRLAQAKLRDEIAVRRQDVLKRLGKLSLVDGDK